MAGSVRYSLVESAFSNRFVGLENYRDTLLNRNFRLSVRNTLELIGLGVPLLTAIALCLALLIEREGQKLPLMRAALLLPMLLPSVAVADVFGKLSFGNPRVPLLAMYVWKNAGFLTLLFLAALSTVPKEVYEAAALDGAGGMRVFFRITLPLIAGTALFAVILAVSYNLRLFREAYLLYGAYPDKSVYLTQHYINNHFYKLNYQKLTSAATLFLGALCALVPPALKISRRASGRAD